MGAKFNPEQLMDSMMDSLPTFHPITASASSNGTEESASSRRKAARSRAKKTGLTTVYMDSVLLETIRAIAAKEGVTLKSIINAGLELFIDAYTAKHGPVKPMKKKTIDDAKSLI